MSDTWYLKSDGWCLTSDIWYLKSKVWCLMFGVWCLMSDVWCLIFDVWCLVFDVWYIILQLFDFQIYSSAETRGDAFLFAIINECIMFDSVSIIIILYEYVMFQMFSAVATRENTAWTRTNWAVTSRPAPCTASVKETSATMGHHQNLISKTCHREARMK